MCSRRDRAFPPRLAARCTTAPNHEFSVTALLGDVCLVHQRRQHMAGGEVVVVVRPVEIGGHHAHVLTAVLMGVALGEFDTGDFGNRVVRLDATDLRCRDEDVVWAGFGDFISSLHTTARNRWPWGGSLPGQRAACHLLRIASQDDLHHHVMRWAVFETWVVGETLKPRYNLALPVDLYFWRDNHGLVWVMRCLRPAQQACFRATSVRRARSRTQPGARCASAAACSANAIQSREELFC